jgi:hypothetical protein
LDDGKIEKAVRRRRSWYRRRLRFQRAFVVTILGSLLLGACWQSAARYFSLPSFHASQVLPVSFLARANVRKDLALAAAQSARPRKSLARIPGIYPYSVIPGGMKDSDDLRYAALRDYVVRRHFAHFDFSRAHIVRATEAREVYLSYRVRDSVFWTRRRIRLHLGELLLTDGKITARTRCGNQISDKAMPEVSDEEPDEDVLDQPVAALDSPAMPVRPVLAPPELPSGGPTAPKLFTAAFLFPYLRGGVPIPSRVCHDGVVVDGHCRPKRHKKPVVPEPSTTMLLASGLALIAWRYNKDRAHRRCLATSA